MSNQTQYHTTESGQKIAYAEYGTPTGTPVFYFHGTPGSRLEIAHIDHQAKAHNLRIIAPDRPGQGNTPFHKPTTLIEQAHDMIDFADALGWDKFVVSGLSGGAAAMYSLAYVAPERVTLGVDIAGWAPVAEYKELENLLAPMDKFFMPLAIKAPCLFTLLFRLFQIATACPDLLVCAIGSSTGTADKKWLQDERNKKLLYDDMVEAFKSGVQGPAQDAISRYSPWGFVLEDVRVPVHIFHGTDDFFAPYHFALWKRDQIKQCTVNTLEGKGHLHPLNMVAEFIANAIEKSKE